MAKSWPIILVGCLLVLGAAGQSTFRVVTGGSILHAVFDFLLIGLSGVLIIYVGYWVSSSEIDSRFYPRIVLWCLGGVGIMVVFLVLRAFHPGIENPFSYSTRATALAIATAAGLGIGVHDARALSREHDLQRERDRFQAVFERSFDAMVIADARGRYVDVNERATELFGLPKEELYGRSIDEFAPDDYDFDREWGEFQSAKNERGTFPLARPDGTERVVEYSASTGIAADQHLSVLRDVTERVEYQRKLEASNERLEQFAYATSHDLQEPLRMVTSYLQLLERRYGDDIDADGEEFIAFAVDGADRMREMIDGLLEYARVETKGEPFEPVDLDCVLEEVRTDLQLQIEESDAEISVEDDSLPHVYGDARQLRQVFQNLLANAIEYRGDDPPRIRVSSERSGDHWLVSVRDDGIGIDPDDADRIFEVFQRLHAHDEYEGTGIGLALCQRIVERHGGRIRVDSESGDGSTFSFTVPAANQR
ncbi:sensor histidine kinase [Natrialbaceae archaeon A-CW3]